MAMRLNHDTLIVSDLDISLAFYTSLGLIPLVYEYEAPRYARLQCPDSDETLSLEVTGENPLPARSQIYFECPELDETYSELMAKGVVFEQAPTDMAYLWREARLSDPDGHAIRLYFAADNRLNPPWKLK